MIPSLNRSLSFKITQENFNKATRKMVTGSSGKSKGKHLEAKQNMEVREQRTETGFS